MKNFFLLFVLLGCFNASIKAQCDVPQAPGTDCASAPLYCEGLDGFCSSLSASTGTSGSFPGCNNQIDNAHYLKFVAGSDFIRLDIHLSNCTAGYYGFAGVEIGIYEECGSESPVVISCNSFTDSYLYITANLTPGETYLLIIDGQYASFCDYSFEVVEGSTAAADLSGIYPNVEGPQFVQQNGTYTFSTDDLPGADYYWNIYGGDLIEGAGTNEVSVNITTDFYFAACVSVGNNCYDSSSERCKDYIVDPVTLNEVEVDICEGECYEFNEQSFCEAGTYDLTINENGTFVDYRIFVMVIPTTETVLSQTACFGECVNYNGVDFCATGQYEIILESSLGCDSIIQLNVEILSENGPSLQVSSTGELDCVNTSTNLIVTSSISGTSFTWAGPGINESNANEPLPEVSVAGEYTVTAVSPQGCTSTETIEVIGSTDEPEVTISGNVPLNCNNAVTTLTASIVNSGATFIWTGPEEFVFNGPTITTDVIGVYEVTATTPSGCVGSGSIIVYANNAPLIVDAGPNRHLQCEFFIDLEATGAVGENVEYEWTTWNGNIMSGGNTLTPRINQPGFYTLTATRLEDGCSGSATIEVYSELAVIENEALEINCEVTSLQIDASASYSGANATIQWSTSNGNIVSGGNTLTPTIDAPGTYSLIISTLFCYSFDAVTVADNTASPTITINASAPEIVCNQPVNLHAEVSPQTATLTWYKEGIEISNEATIEISEGGTYTLEAIGPNACSASESIFIGVNQDPASVSIEGNLSLDCALNGVGHLSANVTGDGGGYTYQWTAGDGGEILSNGIVASASIFGGGTYCVAVASQSTNCTITECVTVEEFSSIQFIPTVVNASCPNSTDGSIQLEVIGGIAPFTFDWSNGATSQNLENIGLGVYSVVLTDANECNAFQTFQIVSSNAATVIAFAGDDRLIDCNSGNITLNGEASVFPDGSNIEWTTEDGNIVEGANTLTPVVNGQGTYTLTIDNGQGCGDSDELMVFEFQASAGLSQSINCENPTVQLNALQNASSASYQWSTDDGNITAGADTPTPTVDAPGTYQLTVTLLSGCIYTDQTTVVANFDEPELSVAATEVALTDCTNPVTISASSSTSGTVLSWSGPGGTAVGGSFTVFDAGTYNVTATAPNGCTNSATVEVVDESDAPDISAPLVQYINCFNGDPLLLDITVSGTSGNYSVGWTSTDGNVVSEVGISIQVDAAGTYTATATDLASGCDASFSIVVEEQEAEINVSSTIANCGVADAVATVSTTYIHDPVFLWSNGATTAVVNGLAPDTYSVTISSAGGLCTEVRTIEVEQDPNCLTIVSGYVFEDAGCSSTANPMEGVLVTVEPEGLQILTNNNGYYEFLVPVGTYTVTPELVSPYVLKCPTSSIQIDVAPGTIELANNNFYTKALSGFDLFVTASSGAAVAGTNQVYYLQYHNYWFTTIFGTIEFQHDSHLEFDAEAAGADYYDPATHTAVFNFTDFEFFESISKSYSLYVPEDVPAGTVLTTTVRILPIQGDVNGQNNVVTWTKVVSGNSSLADPDVPVNAAPGSASLTAGPIEILDQYPNPFHSETTIEFTLEDATDVELQVFDAAGRLVKTYTGYENGWNKQVIPGNDLAGFGLYVYRIVGPEMVVSGRMIRR